MTAFKLAGIDFRSPKKLLGLVSKLWRVFKVTGSRPKCHMGFCTQLDRDGLHDLNVLVNWQRKGGVYWVRYIHVELLGYSHSSSPPPTPAPATPVPLTTATQSATQSGALRVGDRVRVRPTVSQPKYKWGSVSRSSVGTVTSECSALSELPRRQKQDALKGLSIISLEVSLRESRRCTMVSVTSEPLVGYAS